MLIEGIKFSCQACIKGHRQANCSHADRELFEVKKRGRPITACETCRQIRKDNNSHKTCTHCVKADTLEPDLVRSLPHGAADPASMALVRRASSVRSRSSASSANYPALPPVASGSNGFPEEEDLATVGRKKSVSKSRRKDSSAAQRPHDLSHGHLAHHSTHQSAQYSPYGHPHAHPPNHAPLLGTDLPLPPPHRHYTPPLPRPSNDPLQPFDSLGVPAPTLPAKLSNEELAASFFTRGFDQLEVASSASSRPDSVIGNSVASHSSEGAESPTSFKEPPRRPSIGKDSYQLLPPVAAGGRPVKERKRSGLAQMYGAEEEEEQAGEAMEQSQVENWSEIGGERATTNGVQLLAAYPASFQDYANLASVTEELNSNFAEFVQPTEPAATTTFSLPSCDYGVPRSYAPPMAEYSSTAPSAYSAYSGYTPPLARTTSYSVEEEEDPMGALGDLQTQQTDLDILEWIATIAPLPPSSTPASTGESSASSSAVPAFEFQHHDLNSHSVSTPTSYPEPPASSVGLAPSDFAGLALSPGSSELDSTNLFPLPPHPPRPPSSLPPSRGDTASSCSVPGGPHDATSYYFSSSDLEPDLGGVNVNVAVERQQRARPDPCLAASSSVLPPPLPPPARFDCREIDLERYGIDEAYFSRLGSFEPTATPTSTPVHEAFVDPLQWQRRIDETKGLMLEEFGQRTATTMTIPTTIGGLGGREGFEEEEEERKEEEEEVKVEGKGEGQEEEKEEFKRRLRRDEVIQAREQGEWAWQEDEDEREAWRRGTTGRGWDDEASGRLGGGGGEFVTASSGQGSLLGYGTSGSDDSGSRERSRGDVGPLGRDELGGGEHSSWWV